jgi:2,3-dihydro-2,3-dihydroxybenzoate dehydrogenase
MSEQQEFAGRVALVSGATQGIGFAVARRCAQAGATVALFDRDGDAVRAAAASLVELGCVARAWTVDVRDAAAVASAARAAEAALGEVDVLVPCAGVLHLDLALDIAAADWRHSFAVNLDGVFHLVRTLVPGMRARRRGAVVAVGSNAATTPRMGMAAYAASKAAAAQYLRCLGLEVAGDGVRVNLVSPGSTDTAMQRQLWTPSAGRDTTLKGDLARHRLGIPLGRIAEPDDIAEAVLFLASDRARHITLHDLRVDGGATFDA